jgi:EAL domain-containing protein (putative c-di-GMP-specific phosphodiesterase class I)
VGSGDGEGSAGGVAECVVVVGPLGDVRSAGGRTDEVLGRAASALIGTHLRDLLSRPDRGRLFDLMRAALQGAARPDRLEPAPSGALVSVVPMQSAGSTSVDSWVVRFARTTVEPDRPAPRSKLDEQVLHTPEDLSPAAIEAAMRENHFDLDLQPIIDLSTGMPVEAEALVRWVTEGGERLAAGGFIAAIERAGLMPQLTSFVIERSLEQVVAWSGTQSGHRMTVNVTASDLRQPGFIDLVGKLVADAGVDPDRLVLEFGSDLLGLEGDLLDRCFAQLRVGVGVRLAIDQQTATKAPLTTFSSRVTAVKLRPDAGRIVLSSSLDASIVSMLATTLRSSGIDVVGTGIEDKEQLDALQRVGCSHGQGYLLGRPAPSGVNPISTDQAVRHAAGPAATIAWPELERALERWRTGEGLASGG